MMYIEPLLLQLHAQSSGLKALLSDMSTSLIEVCRRSCGGHGYLMSSGVAENMASSLVLVTIEGENTVLFLQTAKLVFYYRNILILLKYWYIFVFHLFGSLIYVSCSTEK